MNRDARQLGLDVMRGLEVLQRGLKLYIEHCDRLYLYLYHAIAARVTGALELVKLADRAEELLRQLGAEPAWALVEATYISAALLAFRYEKLAVAWARWARDVMSYVFIMGYLYQNFPGTGIRHFDEQVQQVGRTLTKTAIFCGAEAELIAQLRVEQPPLVWGRAEEEIARSQEAAAATARDAGFLDFIRALIRAGAERASQMILNPQNRDEIRLRKGYLSPYTFRGMDPQALEREALKLARMLVELDRALRPDTGWPTEEPLMILAALDTADRALEYLRKIRELRTKPRPHFV